MAKEALALALAPTLVLFFGSFSKRHQLFWCFFKKAPTFLVLFQKSTNCFGAFIKKHQKKHQLFWCNFKKSTKKIMPHFPFFLYKNALKNFNLKREIGYTHLKIEILLG